MSRVLKSTRLNLGITLQEVVNKSGLARGTVERAEKGKQPVSYVNAVKIARAISELSGREYTVESLDILTGD